MAKAFIGLKKILVGACNLATANDTWMVTVRRWEEWKSISVCVSVCDIVWVCSESVEWGLRESARMVWRSCK